MRIGNFIGVTGPPPTVEDRLQQALDTENDGFDSLWDTQIMAADTITMLALVGRGTKRIELGTGVVPLMVQRNPVVLAQQALTTQAAAQGRFVLGIGAVSRAWLQVQPGLSSAAPPVYMREYLSILRTLVHERKVEHTGELFRVNTALQVPDAAPVPIMLAALGPVNLRIAGELADGTVTWMVGPRTLATYTTPRITAAAEAAGRPDPRICVGVQVAVTDDSAVGREAATRLFSQYSRRSHYKRLLDMEGVDGPGGVVIVGDEGEVERQLRSYADGGATDFLASIFPVGPDAQASVSRTKELLKSLVGKI